jgi:hypothetical protein
MNRAISLIAALFVATSTCSAQTFDLSWNSIDGGGATFSHGGAFQLGGTIGQPDAGAAMTGGAWSLAGGFWPGAGAPAQAPCSGDIDGDRSVSLSDLAILLSHYGMTTGAAPSDGDLNADGDVDLNDLAQLLALFGSACP